MNAYFRWSNNHLKHLYNSVWKGLSWDVFHWCYQWIIDLVPISYRKNTTNIAPLLTITWIYCDMAWLGSIWFNCVWLHLIKNEIPQRLCIIEQRQVLHLLVEEGTTYCRLVPTENDPNKISSLQHTKWDPVPILKTKNIFLTLYLIWSIMIRQSNHFLAQKYPNVNDIASNHLSLYIIILLTHSQFHFTLIQLSL